MVAIGLALAACLAWGTADFMGGFWTRRTTLWGVIIIGQAAGVVLTLGIALSTGEPPELGAVIPGVLAGLASVIALSSLYQSLAVGVMSIVAPISAMGVILPVLVGIARGERPGGIQAAGMALAVLGVALASSERSAGSRSAVPSRLSLLLAITAALGAGACFIGMGMAAEYNFAWGVFALRATSSLVFMTIVVRLRRPLGVPRAAIPLVALVGILDNGANALFALATTYGYLSVVSVLGNLFAAVTVLLAQRFLRERLAPWQLVGVTAALAGAAMIGVG